MPTAMCNSGCPNRYRKSCSMSHLPGIRRSKTHSSPPFMQNVLSSAGTTKSRLQLAKAITRVTHPQRQQC